MATEHVNVEALIQGIQLKDPRLYQILQELNRGLLNVQEELFPLVLESQAPPTVAAILPPPESFTYAFTPTTVRMFWSAVPLAAGYEVRKGTNWDTASFQFRTSNLLADIDPLKVGSHTYLIKTLNSDLVLSEEARSQVITVPEIGPLTVDKSVIDNNVLLRWNTPTSVFRMRHWKLYRNDVYIGMTYGSFYTFFEAVAGTYKYGVIAEDLAGNFSPLAEVYVTVTAPPDYALQSQVTSQLLGTRVNVIRDAYIPSLLIADLGQTWEVHYSSRGWNTPQDQINAGYPIYFQPTAITGSYEEVIDYGLIINNTIATVTYNQYIYQPNTTVTVKMATSLDNVTYTPFTPGSSQFIPTLRYLKLCLEFQNDSDKAMMELYNLTISLAVKRENDGGSVNALATDTGGTQVNFNKAFKDVESITCSTQSTTEPFTVIFDFQDVPNPVGFKVYVFDSTGNRVTRVVDWKARGII